MGDDSLWTRLKCSPCFWPLHKKKQRRWDALHFHWKQNYSAEKQHLQRVYWQRMAGSYRPSIGNTTMQKQTLLHKLSIHAPFKRHPAPCTNICLSFFLYMYLFCWSMPIYIHHCRTPPYQHTHTFLAIKDLSHGVNGVPGEQRELVIKYRSVNVTVFNTMAAVMLFLFLFGLNCHPRSAHYGRVCVTPPRPHWLCMTECFTFKNLVQRPLSLWHTRGLGSETEKKEQKLESEDWLN